MRTLLRFAFLLVIFASLASAAWWNISWDYKVQVNINSTSVGALTNFPIHIKLDTSNATMYNATTCGNIRILDSTEAISIPYEVVGGCGTANTEIYFQGNLSDKTANTTFYIYSGNLAAASGINRTAPWTGNNYTMVYHFEDNSTAGAGKFLDSGPNAYNMTETLCSTGGVTYPIIESSTATAAGYGNGFRIIAACKAGASVANPANAPHGNVNYTYSGLGMMNYSNCTSGQINIFAVSVAFSSTGASLYYTNASGTYFTANSNQYSADARYYTTNQSGNWLWLHTSRVNSSNTTIYLHNSSTSYNYTSVTNDYPSTNGNYDTGSWVSYAADTAKCGQVTEARVRNVISNADWIQGELGQTWSFGTTLLLGVSVDVPIVYYKDLSIPAQFSCGNQTRIRVNYSNCTSIKLDIVANDSTVIVNNATMTLLNASLAEYNFTMTDYSSIGNWNYTVYCAGGTTAKNSTVAINDCGLVLNMTKAMTSSSFNNLTVSAGGCTVNLTITVANGSSSTVHACSAAGSSYVNTTYDYCQTTCNTTAMAACTHSEDLAWDEDVTDAVYPCDIAITGYDDTVTFNLTKAMTSSSFNNLTTGTGCATNLTITVANASQDYEHTCSAGGTEDYDDTYDYCIVNCSTDAMAACSHSEDLAWDEDVTDAVYPCDLAITGYDDVVVFDLYKDMDSSAFDNQTLGDGCEVNLNITVENASQSYEHTCSAGGTEDYNDTWDYAIFNCTTDPMAACSYHQNLSANETIVNSTYPCDLNITDNTTCPGGSCNETLNLTKLMTNSAFSNQTNQSGCVVNLNISVQNASQSYEHTCSVNGTEDYNDTWDYAIFNCTTDPGNCSVNGTLSGSGVITYEPNPFSWWVIPSELGLAAGLFMFFIYKRNGG